MSAAGTVVRSGVLAAAVVGGIWFGYRCAQELRVWWLALDGIGDYTGDEDEVVEPGPLEKAMRERREQGREVRVHQVPGEIIPGLLLPTGDEVAEAALRTMVAYGSLPEPSTPTFKDAW